ncbi:GDP-mannose 4,6-dehydratase [Lacrimispora sp.]|jgi:GDP-4-dehydro-6-deoxy-D-mannose reductase|uniref:GDP-mannose 4,6-dehydratase n=1 Tax=Lacrimispora sp. TaxID=2719234 RepID=UPI002897CB6F|nr:GDP-mannose 4,6-dehydratase [Lacrimispora sp.]
MKKALIIGAAGFVGSYLIDHIQKNCIWSITVTKMEHERISQTGVGIRDLDILDYSQVAALLKDVRPDYIFHLAAQSSVELSWQNPGMTVDVNIKGSLNVLNGIFELDYKPRILLIGSGEEYGRVKESEIPIIEDNAVRPGNLYAVTKVCQNMIGSIYAQAYGMQIMMVRAFNHIGPNQTPQFVVSDFCKQIAEIENGSQEPVVRVGNLGARRDFTDVRDIVRAYVLLIEKGVPGELYNVGSGQAVSIREILDKIIQFSDTPVSVEIDPAKMRPVDVHVIEADITKLKKCTGWFPVIPLETTLKETLDYWRRELLK